MLKGILPPVFHKKYWRDIMYSRGQAVDYCDLGSHIRDAAAGNPHRGRYRHVPGTIHAQHTAGGAGGGAGAAAPSRSRAHHAKAAKPLNHGAALARSTEPIETTTRGRRDTAAIKLQQALDEVRHTRLVQGHCCTACFCSNTLYLYRCFVDHGAALLLSHYRYTCFVATRHYRYINGHR